MPPRKKNDHCSYCGQRFAAEQVWPRLCAPCGSISYLNPTPVAVVLLPVDDGLLCVRRAIEPAVGKLALPGGFLDFGETWQEGCVRELREETGVEIAASEVTLFAAHSAAREGLLLVFGVVRRRALDQLPAFQANEEASEMVVLREACELAFPLHTRVMAEFFALREGASRAAELGRRGG